MGVNEESASSIVAVAAYDIADDRRRQDISEYLSRYGARVQLSVVETDVPDRSELGRIIDGLRERIEPAEDQVRLWAIPAGTAAARTTVLGLRTLEERRDFHII